MDPTTSQRRGSKHCINGLSFEDAGKYLYHCNTTLIPNIVYDQIGVSRMTVPKKLQLLYLTLFNFYYKTPLF